MAITTPADGEARVTVRVVRGFRAEGGQEFLPGWTCGFSEAVAAELVERGLAERVLTGQALQFVARTAVMQPEDVVTGSVAATLAPSAVAPATPEKPRRKKP